eukprot:EG_transcript_37329
MSQNGLLEDSQVNDVPNDAFEGELEMFAEVVFKNRAPKPNVSAAAETSKKRPASRAAVQSVKKARLEGQPVEKKPRPHPEPAAKPPAAGLSKAKPHSGDPVPKAKPKRITTAAGAPTDGADLSGCQSRPLVQGLEDGLCRPTLSPLPEPSAVCPAAPDHAVGSMPRLAPQ